MEDKRNQLRKFVVPEIVFGTGALDLAGRYVKNFGGTKALVVTDPGIIEAGWTVKVTDTLEELKIPYAVFSDLTINPKDHEVMNGAEFCMQEKCDLIVAVGGGSVVDCAKGIGIVSTNRKHILEFEGVDQISLPGPPLVCVPTTAGSAADVSQFTIITDSTRRVKVSIISKALVPDVSLVDPQTTLTMDRNLTISTGFDALAHAIESYVSNANSPFTDLHALKAVRILNEFFPLVMKKPSDTTYRREMMLGSTHAGFAFSNASLGLIHAMAHAIGGVTNAVHGECNAMLTPFIIDFNFDSARERYIDIGKAMGMDFPKRPPEDHKNMLTDKLKKFRDSICFDRCYGDLGVTRENIPQMALNASRDACIATNPRPASVEEIQGIYERALGFQV
ncbi:MAG: alcohol dehydrogenase-like regulatory protein ErcA [Chitinispirillaceae bacterium]